MLARKELGVAFGPGSHGSTFGGNKMAMTVAKMVINEIAEQNILANVTARSEELFWGLKEIDSPLIKTIRGKGLMIGIVLKDAEMLPLVLTALEEKGLLTLRAGKNVLRLLPPLTITKSEINHALHILSEMFSQWK